MDFGAGTGRRDLRRFVALTNPVLAVLPSQESGRRAETSCADRQNRRLNASSHNLDRAFASLSFAKCDRRIRANARPLVKPMNARTAVLSLLVAGTLAANDAVDRCIEASHLLDEIMATPEKSISHDLLAKAHCVALIPGVKKAAFVIGGRYGKGVIQCRHGEGWTGPSTIRLEGGSFGFQIGGSSTDVVLLVMNEGGREKLLASKFTLGGDAAVAGGPIGRSAQAQTDAQMEAKILSYSRSRGVFAGVSLAGATLRPDHDANEQIYGIKVNPKEILSGKIPPPEATRDLSATLARYSSGEQLATVETAPAPKPKPARESGLLSVTSAPPFAEVEINKAFNGLTPRKKVLDSGEYELRISKKGFEPWTRIVVISPGETVELHAELTKPNVDPKSAEDPADSDRKARKVKPASNAGFKVVGLP